MYGLPKFGDGIGLHRIERFYRAHGIDTTAMSRRSIIVTGSNVKKRLRQLRRVRRRYMPSTI